MRVRAFGVDLGVTRAWLVFQGVGLLGFSLLAYLTVLGHTDARLTPAGAVWVGGVLLAALDATVVVHECGHLVAAVAAGIRVRAVLLLAYGGATVRDASPNTGVDRFTAAAGPMANFAFAGLGAGVLRLLEPEGAAAAVLGVAVALQLLNGLVNLLPLPRCDGARLFR